MDHEAINAPVAGPADPEQLDTRKRIMQAAITLFSRQGFDATPVREIVQEAGVTKPVLYYYFKNKEDLFQEIITDLLDTFGEELSEICTSTPDDFEVRLAAIADLHFVAARSQPDLIRFVYSIFFSGLFDRLFDFHAFWGKEIDQMAKLFEQAQTQGIIRGDLPAHSMAYQFMGLILHWMQGMVYCPETIATEPDGAAIVKVLMEGINGRNEIHRRQ